MIIKRVYNIKMAYWDLDYDPEVVCYRQIYHEFDVDYQESENSEIKTIHLNMWDLFYDECSDFIKEIIDKIYDNFKCQLFNKTMEASQQNPFELDLCVKD